MSLFSTLGSNSNWKMPNKTLTEMRTVINANFLEVKYFYDCLSNKYLDYVDIEVFMMFCTSFDN